MNEFLLLIDAPTLSEFISNPIQTLSAVLTSPFGVFGYIFVMLALITITWSYTKNIFSIGLFIIVYGVVADILYPLNFAMIVNIIGVGIIFGGVLYEGVFKDRL